MKLILYFLSGQIQDKTVGKAKLMKIEKVQQEQTSVEDKNEVKSDKSDSILDLIKPVNEIIQKLLREASVDHPSALSELLTIDSSDLIKVFRRIFTKTDDIEDSYRQLLKGVEEHGAAKFVEQFSDIEYNESDSLEKGYLQKLDNIFKNLMSKPGVLSKMDNSQIHQLYREYLTQVIRYLIFVPS